MQINLTESIAIMPTALDERLKKCFNEDNVECQPLYIDNVDECIKCTWCPAWPGSQEVKWVNHIARGINATQKPACVTESKILTIVCYVRVYACILVLLLCVPMCDVICNEVSTDRSRRN